MAKPLHMPSRPPRRVPLPSSLSGAPSCASSTIVHEWYRGTFRITASLSQRSARGPIAPEQSPYFCGRKRRNGQQVRAMAQSREGAAPCTDSSRGFPYGLRSWAGHLSPAEEAFRPDAHVPTGHGVHELVALYRSISRRSARTSSGSRQFRRFRRGQCRQSSSRYSGRFPILAPTASAFRRLVSAALRGHGFVDSLSLRQAVPATPLVVLLDPRTSRSSPSGRVKIPRKRRSPSS